VAEREPRVKKSELLRTKIYHSAIDLFAERGFENVKISDICEAAEISTGTFYYYFPSKEAVFLQYAGVADGLMDKLAAEIECDTQAERLKQLVLQKVHMFSVVGQKLSNACLSAFLKHNDVSYLDIHRSAYAHFMHAVEMGKKNGEFRSDIDTYQAVSILRYMIGGLVMHWVASKEYFDIDTEIGKLVDSFISGLK